MPKQPRDVVVVRVSEQGDRDEENFHSPKAQLAKAKLWSEDQGNRVVAVFEEIDVSGRPGPVDVDDGRRRRPVSSQEPLECLAPTSAGVRSRPVG